MFTAIFLIPSFYMSCSIQQSNIKNSLSNCYVTWYARKVEELAQNRSGNHISGQSQVALCIRKKRGLMDLGLFSMERVRGALVCHLPSPRKASRERRGSLESNSTQSYPAYYIISLVHYLKPFKLPGRVSRIAKWLKVRNVRTCPFRLQGKHLDL